MKIKFLFLALGALFLFCAPHMAVAVPATQPGALQMSVSGGSVAEPVYYYGRRGYVHGPRGGYAYGRRGYVRGPYGHGCVGGRRCVGGYYRGACRSWAVCR